MRLKRLEIVGFKSFANRVKLEFDTGITAIVGPNGSGKSNISDAIRWVLGEQSIKSLRGSKLEDVIFAGSDGKRPLGMAEVQLTLDNSDGFLPLDYNEVTITRRVYRSGDSEFLINRQACRLRDIQDLFTDTGLGREGFAIIGQGQIDAVLSANPLDRRFILEETAGIVKYRNRREQAQKKMTQTEYDLVRVSDILSELKDQLGPLEVQANKARRYQVLSGQLEAVVLDKLTLQLNELCTKETQFQGALAASRSEAEELTEEYQKLELILIQEQEQLSSLERRIEENQLQINDVNERINQTMQTIGLIEERLKHNRQTQSERAKQSSDYAEQIQGLLVKLDQLNQQLEHKQSQYQLLEQAVQEAEARVNIKRETLQHYRRDLEMKKSAFIEFVQELADARNFGLNYQRQLNQLEQQLEAIKQEAEEFAQAVKVQQEKIEQQRQYQQQLEHKQRAYEEKLQQYAAACGQHEQELQQLVDKEQQAADRYRQIRSRLQALKDLEVEYEGYNYSVRRLIKAKIPRVTILGTVADVISVPPGLETAIEVALGAGLQYIITPHEHDAKQAIEWLKQQRAGRCTFLPLNNIKGSTFPASFQKFWQQENCLGPAVNLLQFDPMYLPAINALLGRVVVVKDLDTALIMQRELPSFSRIVTLAGEVVMPNGSLTGGSISQKTHGILARKNEITQLEQELTASQDEIAAVGADKAKLDQKLHALKAEQENIYQRSHQLELALHAAASESNQLENDLRRLKQQLEAKEQQLQDYQTALFELQNEAAASQDNVAALEQNEQAKRDEIIRLEQEIAVLEQELDSDSEFLTTQKIACTGAAAEVKQLQEHQAAVQQQLAQNQKALDTLEADIKQLEDQFQQLQQELTANKELEEQLKAEKLKIGEQAEQDKAARVHVQESIKQISQKLKSLQTRIAKVDKSIYNHQLELERIDLELRRIDEELRERELERGSLTERAVTTSMAELVAQETDLKAQIRALGVVNLAALEDYEAVRERVFFLQAQFDDLVNAKETLNQTISEIDEASAERLSATYEELRREFQAMFTQLFKGGKADLELTDPDNILESGVNITAQPPGKKPQNLLLLSGGERALTAIALLLAIRRVQPTPFCVLDEIDAALDEANLKRFTEQLRKLAETTQFLIITHRPGTMEMADRLYGITMSDDAVSQLMSVQLTKE